MKMINFKLSDETLHKRIKIACAVNGITITEFLNTSIIMALKIFEPAQPKNGAE